MKKILCLIASVTAICFLLSFSSSVISEEQEGTDKAKADTQEEEVYERIAKEFPVDKATIKDLEKKERSLENVVRILILAEKRTDRLIKRGEFPEEKRTEVFQESINHFLKMQEAGLGWGDLAEELDMTIGDDLEGWTDKILNRKRQGD